MAVIDEETLRYFEKAEEVWDRIEALPEGKEKDELILLLKRADKAWNAGNSRRAWQLIEEIEKRLAIQESASKII